LQRLLGSFVGRGWRWQCDARDTSAHI
jgi:hypothetical protein